MGQVYGYHEHHTGFAWPFSFVTLVYNTFWCNVRFLWQALWVERLSVHLRPAIYYLRGWDTPKVSTCSVPDTQNLAEMDFSHLEPQSGIENVTYMTGAPSTTEQNVGFTDLNPSYTYQVDSAPDETYGSADTPVDLQQFFQRPIRIADYSWTVGTTLFESFDPWSLFFENSRNINRISNFNLLRAKLHVKILVNGNGFHYGRALAAYQPLHTIDDVTKDRAFFTQDLVEATQRPHIFIDPTFSQGGEMVLPFFWYKNALKIPESEWNQMGQVVISSFDPLKHANGAVDTVTVSVFAWAEDVHLSVPTTVNPNTLVPQSGKAKGKSSYTPKKSSKKSKGGGGGSKPSPSQPDEHGKGVISQPATAVAKIAGMLTNAPLIGPYAKATQIGAGAVANIASMFGFSRPTILNDTMPFRPEVMGNMANTNMPDSTTTLAVDCKQEVTIDPRTVGLAQSDEMDITSIASRESFLFSFPWAVSAPSNDTRLAACVVNPVVYQTGPADEIHMPACCFAAMPFRFWRGTMRYRFQIVASNFHKGRLRISWDPNNNGSTEYNTQYTRIVDIAEEKDFTIEVGWGNQYQFLKTRRMVDLLSDGGFIVGNGVSLPNTDTANGVIHVSVVNALTVPNTTVDNDITVNVFVSACDDFEVACPETSMIERMTLWTDPQFVPQSGMESGSDNLVTGDAENTEGASKPTQDKEDTIETFGADICHEDWDDDPQMLVYFGETIKSVRGLLKRYCWHSASTHDDGVGTLLHQFPALPYYPGYNPDSPFTTSLADPFSYSQNTFLNWFTPAYGGYRGSTRWKIQMMGLTGDSTTNLRCTRSTIPINGTPYVSENLALPSGSSSKKAFDLNVSRFWTGNGSHATSTEQNSVLEVEVPFYSQDRFIPAKNVRNIKPDYRRSEFLQTTHTITGEITSDQNCWLENYTAAGEDYSLYFFLGSPVVHYTPTPLPAA